MAAQAGASEIRQAEDLARELLGLGDDFDILLFQAEAIALLEAAVKAIAQPSGTSASIITSVYGHAMERWFQSGGSDTVTVDLSEAWRAVTAAETRTLLTETPGVRALAVVQGEALTGVVNPIDEIADAAAERGIDLMVDSVSSVGAEPFRPQRWGRVIAVCGAQKALGGPSGLSFAVIAKPLWESIESNPEAPRDSFLSLLDIKHSWLDSGRREFFGMPNAEELAALLPALRKACDTGLEELEAQHLQARDAVRAAVREIDRLRLNVSDQAASWVATTFESTDPKLTRAQLLARLGAGGVTTIKPAAGDSALRWVHYAEHAEPAVLARTARALSDAVTRR